jgi:hypothetical protein
MNKGVIIVEKFQAWEAFTYYDPWASHCETKATCPRKLNSEKSYHGTLEENTTATQTSYPWVI